jgi:hypothetical protein
MGRMNLSARRIFWDRNIGELNSTCSTGGRKFISNYVPFSMA